MIGGVRKTATRLRGFQGLVVASAMLCSSAAPASPFGINAHIPNDAVLDRVVEAGIEWVRIDFVWSKVELERDVYDWRTYDGLVDRLEARGLKAYATLQGTPAWATSGPEFSGVPDDPDQWQEFVYLAASRYRGRITAWGVWNEPNSDRFWLGSRDEYIFELLIPASTAIRTADPKALVAGPDLAHLSSLDWDGWLRDVIVRAGDHLDVITHHYYPSYGKAWELVYDFDEKVELPWGAPSVRDLLIDTGWWGRPFWLTETGVESAVEGPGDQADYYEDVMTDWFGYFPEGRWIDRVFFYQMNDPPSPSATTWGIVGSKPDLVPKPAFFAYQRVIPEVTVDDAELVDLTAPAFVIPGQRGEIAVTFRNIGTSTWDGPIGFRIDARIHAEGWWFESDAFDTDFTVRPGETVRFVMHMQAPSNVEPDGRPIATFEARMVADDGRRFGKVASAAITATSESPPKIVAQPKAATLFRGQRVVLAVDADSDSPLTYRWRKNSVELADSDHIQGSSTPNLKLGFPDASLAGDYDCIVTNDAGSIMTETVSVEAVSLVPRSPDTRRTHASAAAGRLLTHPVF
jgi:hypothetical protein